MNVTRVKDSHSGGGFPFPVLGSHFGFWVSYSGFRVRGTVVSKPCTGFQVPQPHIRSLVTARLGYISAVTGLKSEGLSSEHVTEDQDNITAHHEHQSSTRSSRLSRELPTNRKRYLQLSIVVSIFCHSGVSSAFPECVSSEHH